MNDQKLALNTISGLMLQVVTVICGFILPRAILGAYGSSVNGLINSITQFVGVISFLELGIGAVVQSALYSPLSSHNNAEISKIWVSAQKFFRTLAVILVGYIIVLLFVFPVVIAKEFPAAYTIVLILAMSVSWFSQYYFGIVNGLLLKADQRGYVLYITQAVTLILNTISCVVLMNNGASIQAVKIATSLIYLVRPYILYVYVNKNYIINKKIKYAEEPIKQKWNGVAQHVAAVVLDGTDVIVLSTFANLQAVSVYSVFYLVTSGIKQLFFSITNPIQAFLGSIWASKDYERFNQKLLLLEWELHTFTTFIFGCVFLLIQPFVLVYTRGINDANYNQQLFAYLITIAYYLSCLRMPYFDIAVKACNHYKETQNNFIIAALLNISSSIILVFKFGLIGVAIGTIIAMTYQVSWMALYTYKNLIKCSVISLLKQVFVDAITLFSGLFLLRDFRLSSFSYFSWVILAIKVAAIWVIIILIVNLIFYRNEVIHTIQLISMKLRRNKTDE